MNLGTPEQQSLENMKESIKIIEGMFYGLEGIPIPLKLHDPVMNGLNFLSKIHANLLAQIGPEEVQKMKDESNKKLQPSHVN